MVEVTSDDKKLWGKVVDAMRRNESFHILIKGKKTEAFKKAYSLNTQYSKTKNLFVFLKCCFCQISMPSIWSVMTAAQVDYELKISDSDNGDVLVTGTPKIQPIKS
jgi:hypothetical protein